MKLGNDAPGLEVLMLCNEDIVCERGTPRYDPADEALQREYAALLAAMQMPRAPEPLA